MTLRARWQARRRLPTGTHVPHPAIRTRRLREASWPFDPPLRLWVDGVAHGSVTIAPRRRRARRGARLHVG